MLTPRLVFGCARLTGGFSSSEARRLVDAALRAGFRHFDTAPSYGIGTAESVIGSVLGSQQDVAITAKVGSIRPRFAVAKTAARRALRFAGFGGKPTSFYEPAMPNSAHQPDGCFDMQYMEQSLARTLANLRRSSVTYLLLHESYRGHSSPDVVAFLAGLIAGGIAEHVGFANSAVYDAALHSSCPAHWTAQAAIHPDMLLRPVQLARPIILHSLLKSHLWLGSIDPAYALATEHTLDKFVQLAPRHSLATLLPYYLATRNVPEAKLICGTSELARLNDIIASTAAIDESADGYTLASAFSTAYHSYRS